MVAPVRNKLANKFDGSIFYHILENEEVDTHEHVNVISAAEEVHERNFRDLRYHNIHAAEYVHCLILCGMIQAENPHRFVILNHMNYMPEVDNKEEEIMMGEFSPDLYKPTNVLSYSISEIFKGLHLEFDEELILLKYNAMLSEPQWNNEMYFYSYFTSNT